MGQIHSLILCFFCIISLQIAYAKAASIASHEGSPSITPVSTLATVTIKTSTYTINPAHVVIAGHTLLPGGSSIIVNGEEIRLDSSRNLRAGETILYHHHKNETKTSTNSRSDTKASNTRPTGAKTTSGKSPSNHPSEKTALQSSKAVKSRSTLTHSTIAPPRDAVPPLSTTAHQPSKGTAVHTTMKQVKTNSALPTLSKAITKPTPHPKAKSDGSNTTVIGPVVVVPPPVVSVIPVAPPVVPPVIPPGPEPKNPESPPQTTPSFKTSSSSTTTTSTTCPSSATACGSCDFVYDPYPVVDDGSPQRRALAGRVMLKKRAPPADTTMVGGKMCSVAPYIAKPAYPVGYQITSAEAVPTPSMDAFFKTGTYWAVPTAGTNCAAPGWAFKDTAQVLADGYSIGGRRGKTVNIDHVYEKGTLDEFFLDQISAGFTCPNIQVLFDPPGSMNGETRLSKIFAQLASFENPDFLGMDAGLNGLKGSLWNPGLQGISNHKGNPNAMLSLLGNIAVVMSMVQDPKVKKLFEDTNTRIYQAFQGIDVLLKNKANCNQPVASAGGGGPLSATWAPAYSSWIANKVSSQNALIVSTASQLGNSILQYQTNNDSVGNKLSTAFHSFTKAYVINTMTFDYDLTGMVGAPLIIQRDQEACMLSSTSASATKSDIITKISAKATASAPPTMTSKPYRFTFSSLPGEPTPPPIPTSITWATPPLPASTVPPPPIASNAIVIYHYASCAQMPCLDTAHVYDIIPGATVSPCSGPGVFSEPLNSDPTPDLAVQIGPFTSHGVVGCVFSGTAYGGSLTCPGLAGGAPINCVVPDLPTNVHCVNPSNTGALSDFAWELGYCEW